MISPSFFDKRNANLDQLLVAVSKPGKLLVVQRLLQNDISPDRKDEQSRWARSQPPPSSTIKMQC